MHKHETAQWMQDMIVADLREQGAERMACRVEIAANELDQMAQRAERAEQRLETAQKWIDGQADRLSRAEAECERLREALRPIARWADHQLEHKTPAAILRDPSTPVHGDAYSGEPEITVADLRRTLTALSNVAPQSDDDVRHKAACGKQVSDKWQPIETAPKDREILVAYKVREDIFEFAVASYLEDSGFGTIQSFPDMSYVTAHPTHWMPLPTPPKTGGE